jgi:hypothetical protein
MGQALILAFTNFQENNNQGPDIVSKGRDLMTIPYFLSHVFEHQPPLKYCQRSVQGLAYYCSSSEGTGESYVLVLEL